MRTFVPLSLLAKEKILAWKRRGLSDREIGQKLQRPNSTSGREIKRPTRYGKVSDPCLAQRRSERIGYDQRGHAPLKEPLIFLYVREHLREGWSPETIAGRLPIDHPGYSIDKETVYRYVDHRRNRRERRWQYLIRARKKRMKKSGRRVKRSGKIPGAVSIDLRPKSILKRKQFGHFASDNLEGLRSDKSVLSVTLERRTRKVFLSKRPNRKSEGKTQALIRDLNDLAAPMRRRLTLDNGSENSRHLFVSQILGIDVYFGHAHSAWEKGTAENTIGRLRRFIPKGESLEDLNQEGVKLSEERFNNTPRKCLGFLTPNEVEVKILSTLRSH